MQGCIPRGEHTFLYRIHCTYGSQMMRFRTILTTSSIAAPNRRLSATGCLSTTTVPGTTPLRTDDPTGFATARNTKGPPVVVCTPTTTIGWKQGAPPPRKRGGGRHPNDRMSLQPNGDTHNLYPWYDPPTRIPVLVRPSPETTPREFPRLNVGRYLCLRQPDRACMYVGTYPHKVASDPHGHVQSGYLRYPG